MKPFHELVDVRPDVRDGTLDQSAYAANLGDVAGDVDKPAAREYRDPRLFKEMTYETRGMRRVLDDIRVRLQEGRGNGVRQIETSFGGGKTHAMIAMYHKCREWGAMPVVIDGQSLGVSYTLWGEIERQLDGHTNMMSGKIAPSGTQIYELLHDREKPILILIDEIFNYVASAAGEIVGKSDLAAQTILFVQRLNGQLGNLPNVCLVMSLSNRDDVLDPTASDTARMQNEYYTKLQKIVGRQHQLVTVSEYNDISHIIRRRLFTTKEDIIQYGARDIIQWCVDTMKDGGSLSGDDIREYAKKFGDTYPFTPDVISLLHERWGSYPTFQRTRGVLRLLSLVVHSLLKSDRAWISPGDIDLSIPEISKELLKHTGDNAESVIVADIVGDNALAKNEGESGVRCASSVFMYSFPSTVGGATHAEVKRSALTSEISHSVVGDVIGKLLRRLYYLKQTDDSMLWFDVTPNLNHMIAQAKRNVPDTKVRGEELKRLRDKNSVRGGKFANVIVWPDETESGTIPDEPNIQLIICKSNKPEWCARMVNGTDRSRRINMNGLVFLLPGDGSMLNDLLRSYLALKTVQHLRHTRDYTKAERAHMAAEIKRVEQSLGDALRKKYSVVYIPEKNRGVVKIRDYVFNPKTDGSVELDHLLWGRLVDDDHIATRIAPDIAARYGTDPDSAYKTMIRTPGNVMPASLEAVQEAFEVEQIKDTPDETPPELEVVPVDDNHSISGEDSWGELLGGEPPQDERKTHERMVYTEVVDASGLDTVRSLLWEPKELSLTEFGCTIKLRPDGMYDVRLEMRGEIPDRVVSSINRGHVDTDGGWDE